MAANKANDLLREVLLVIDSEVIVQDSIFALLSSESKDQVL